MTFNGAVGTFFRGGPLVIVGLWRGARYSTGTLPEYSVT